jgi:Flp pilus assembly protein TadD/mono/diheme cytochrome c family protein
MRLLRSISVACVCSALVICSHTHRAIHAAESTVSWSRQIAPLVYQNCTTCHHPGGSGPFSLLTYEDARRRGPQMVQVTQSHYMPPWLPAPGYGEFAGARRLSEEQVTLIRKWVESGMPQGETSAAPQPPQYDATWQLGTPDLVLTIERPYTLAASGTDVFRNFILPYPLAQTHFIRAMEILPSLPQVVHHANVILDRTASFRSRHATDWKDGIAGMELEVDAGNTFDPDSHFLFWKPDTPVLEEREGMPWRLDPGNDLILNMHLKPSGKPEAITAQIGLYFTSEPAAKHPMLLQLEDDRDLDIPAGDRNFVVQDELKLPVDVEVFGIYPHAHYLGKELEGWAMLPTGEKKWLVRIPNWDIDRQSVYRYRDPVFLPRGTVLHMHYVYDNSQDNIHNPNTPSIRVRAGNRSVDEMAHLWLQVLPVNVPQGGPDPRLLLEQAWMEHRLAKDPEDTVAQYNLASAMAGLGRYAEAAAEYRKLLAAHPDDARTLNSLGAALESTGDWQRASDAYAQAIALEPGACDAWFNLADLALKRSEFAQAQDRFRSMLGQCPSDAEAHSELGVALLGQGDSTSAQEEFEHGLELDPENFTALYHLGEIAIESGQPERAIDLLHKAATRHPDDLDTRERLAMALAQSGRLSDSLAQLRQAVRLAPDDASLHALFSQVLAGSGQLEQAIEEQNHALHLQPKDADGWNNLGVLEARAGNATEARADFQRALKLAPDHAQARANLARLPRQ